MSNNREEQREIRHEVEVDWIVKGLYEVEDLVDNPLQYWSVDIKVVSTVAAKFLKDQRRVFIQKILSDVILEGACIEIIDLTDDSEGEKILDDVCWRSLLADNK